jgi:hypothetical protein
VVDAIDEHRRVVLGRRRLHDLLGAGGDVLLAAFLGQEQAGGVDHQVGADFVPLQFGGILDGRQADLLAIDHQVVAFDGNVALEVAMHRVVLQHVGEIVRLQQVVDADDLDVRELGFLGDGTKHHATDATETIDANFDSHLEISR